MAYPTDALAAQMAGMNLPPGQPDPTASAPPAPVPQGYPAPQQGYPAPQQGYPTPQQGYPAPQQGYPVPQQGYPAPQQGYPAPQQGYPAPQQGYPAPQQGYPAPQQVPQGVPPGGLPPPQGAAPPPPAAAPAPAAAVSAMPIGFSIMDAFRQNNVIQLVSRASGNLVCVRQSSLRVSDDFVKNDGMWNIIVETNQSYVLQNVQWPGCHIAIKSKGKEITLKKNDKQCQFRVEPLPDNYVTLQSVEFPGAYVGFNSKGGVSNPKELGPGMAEAQFFVRIIRQKHPFSQTIMTPFSRPSVFASLADRSIVQLHTKPSNNYLAISGSGIIFTTVNGNDENTFFIWMDHGMGIVSLQSRKYQGYRFRMCNFQLTPKGEADLNGDFRVMENSDGTVSFESVTCGGGYLGIPVGSKPVTHISLFLVTIQKFGKSETVTKTPIN